MKNRILQTSITRLLLAGTLLAASSAQAAPVDLELALLVDVSGSVSTSEFNTQRDGYVAAFRDNDLIDAITSGNIGSIAVTLWYWSGAGQQQQAVGWTLIDSDAAGEAFADDIAAAARPFSGLTAPGSAINAALPGFATNGFEGTFQKIDVSGDGI